MLKFLLTAIIFLTKYQGREGRTYTITNALGSISLFFTVDIFFIILIFTDFFNNKENRIVFFYLSLSTFFLLVLYFFQAKKNRFRLHHSEYKKFVKAYFILLFLPLPLYFIYLLIK